MFWFDPLYLILIMPVLILASVAQSRVRGAFEHYSQVKASAHKTGAEVARELLHDAGIYDVQIEQIDRGELGDHYDPRSRTVRLSPNVFRGRSLAAFGIAAHEAGHAIQHHTGYVWLGMRNAIIPVTQFGSSMAFPLFFIGLLIAGTAGELLMTLGIVFFGAALVFQLITLPVEYNASARAMYALEAGGYVRGEQRRGVRAVLNAAALTYLAAALMALMQFVYLLLLRGRRR